MLEKLWKTLRQPRLASAAEATAPQPTSEIPLTHASVLFSQAFERIQFLLEDNYQKTCILQGHEEKFDIAKSQGFMIKALAKPAHPHAPTVNELHHTLTFCSDNTLFANTSLNYLKESGLTPHIHHDFLPIHNTSVITIRLDFERLDSLFTHRSKELASSAEPAPTTKGRFTEAEEQRRAQRSEASRATP